MIKFLRKFFTKKPEYSDAMFAGELGDIQKELTELAVYIGNQYSLNLDFSHESIKNVEQILADIHDQFKETGDDEGLTGVALEFGFYIAATIQNTTGTGHLERDHPEIGESSFPFYWKENTMFTYAWCEKRIFDGPEDDVVMKYKIFVLDEIEKAAAND